MSLTLEALPTSLRKKLADFPPRLVRALFVVLEEDWEQEKVAKDLTPTA